MNTHDFKDYKKMDVLDLAQKDILFFSYLLRLLGFAGFTALLIALTRLVHPDLPTNMDSYLNIALPGVPGIVSVLLAMTCVFAVLLLHECVHASAFYLDQGIPPRLGARGLLIFASAPGHLVGRSCMMLNALAPFLVISGLGFLLITLLPEQLLSWVFIPTVANAAASGGDFIAFAWLIKQPKATYIEDTGDVLTAYQAAV